MLATHNATDIMDLEERYLAPTYKRAPFVLERGDGVCLFDTEGRRYLDLVAGIATVALGHADPAIAEAISEQARILGHVSNLYHSIPTSSWPATCARPPSPTRSSSAIRAPRPTRRPSSSPAAGRRRATPTRRGSSPSATPSTGGRWARWPPRPARSTRPPSAR